MEIIEPYALFNLTFVDQIYLMFRAKLMNLDFGPGPESREVTLMSEKNIPWDEIAFNVIHKILRCYFMDKSNGSFQFKMGDIEPNPLHQ